MRTVRAFGKELLEVNAYRQMTDQVFSLAKIEALLRAGFFGVVSAYVCEINFTYIAQHHKCVPMCMCVCVQPCLCTCEPCQ